jgi:hypothetical protein
MKAIKKGEARMKAIKKGDWVRFRKPAPYLGIVDRREGREICIKNTSGSFVHAAPGELVVVGQDEILGLVWNGLTKA